MCNRTPQIKCIVSFYVTQCLVNGCQNNVFVSTYNRKLSLLFLARLFLFSYKHTHNSDLIQHCWYPSLAYFSMTFIRKHLPCGLKTLAKRLCHNENSVNLQFYFLLLLSKVTKGNHFIWVSRMCNQWTNGGQLLSVPSLCAIFITTAQNNPRLLLDKWGPFIDSNMDSYVDICYVLLNSDCGKILATMSTCRHQWVL